MDIIPYQVQYAKSNRAKCKQSGDVIPKGSIKIVTEHPGNGDFTMTKSFKVTCFKLPRKLKCTVEEFVDEYLQDTSEEQDILPAKRDEIIRDLEIAQAATKKKASPKKEEGGNDSGEESLMDRLKEAAKTFSPPNDDSDDDDDKASKPPAAKKAKTEDGSAKPKDPQADFEDMLGLYHKYGKMKVPELKDRLRWNKQLLKGGKDFILFKVLDGEVNGRLGQCPLCAGDLKFEEGDYDTVHCGGRYDEDLQRRVSCTYTVGRLDPKCIRLLPWYTEKPSEEEMEAMEKAKEAARGELEGGDYADQPIAVELLAAAEGLTVDFDSNEGKKNAVKEYLGLVEGKLDLPEGRNIKMEVGRVVMAELQENKTPKEIMQSLIAKFGLKEVKEKKLEQKKVAAQSACANPANAKLILALKECSEYYFKEGNRNAGGAYVRAVESLMNLDEEVTEKNAMAFSKGPNKLPNIGASTAQRMLEFVKTGTFAKLEEKRAAHS